MNRKTTALTFILLSAPIALLVALLFLLAGAAAPAQADPPLHIYSALHLQASSPITRYVAVTGSDAYTCTKPISACRTVQHAVDVAHEGDVIKVASGVYTGVQPRPAPPGYDGPSVITQVVYISKTLTIQGGYTTTNWTTPHPITQPTTLDAQEQGRVIFIGGDISPTVEGLHITNGDADWLGGGDKYGGSGGGGIYATGATVAISANHIFSNTSHAGGGVCLRDSIATLDGNTVTTNTACTGGGLYLRSSDATLSENSIISNAIRCYGHGGGGLYLEETSATLVGNVIAANRARGGGWAGGLGAWHGDITLISNTVVSNLGEQGGGLLLEDVSTAVLISNTFAANTAYQAGGVSLRTSGTVTIVGNSFVSNTAKPAGGGGLLLAGYHMGEYPAEGPMDSALLSGNTFISNTANYGMGGMAVCYVVTATLDSNAFIANTAGSESGGLYVCGGNFRLVNNVIVDNRTVPLPGPVIVGGSGLRVNGASVRMLHNTIAHNTGVDGSGIYIASYDPSTVTLFNTILASHTVGINVTAGNTVTLEATLWGGGAWANETEWAGEGAIFTGTVNIWGDPAFVDPDAGDYHIGPHSAAIDRGVYAGVDDDFDGEPRPMGQGYDIGADEAWWRWYMPMMRHSVVVTSAGRAYD
jgi:hypothetical protein